jgi:hypothetical protein
LPITTPDAASTTSARYSTLAGLSTESADPLRWTKRWTAPYTAASAPTSRATRTASLLSYSAAPAGGVACSTVLAGTTGVPSEVKSLVSRSAT